MSAPSPEEASLLEARTHEAFVTASDGTRIFYRVVGEGPPVVLCDGILCDGFVWKYLRPHLARRFTVVHWHYRGHGRSGRVRDLERVHIEDHADDLKSVLDAAGIERAVLIGHSMGTQVCLEAYRRSPERVQALVLVCGSYGRITRTFHNTDALARVLPAVLDYCAKHPRWVQGLIALTPGALAVQIARLAREIDPVRMRAEDMLPYFQHIAGMDPAVFLRMLKAAGEHSAEDTLHRVDVPTLVIAGELDSFTPSRLAKQMAEQIREAQFEMVTDGSHACPIEQPALVNDWIETFLTSRAFPPR